MAISYAKGARTWERHVDLDYQGVPVSTYCSLPEQIDTWFKTFHKATEMCGNSSNERRVISRDEIVYLDALVRGVYVASDLPAGFVVDHSTFAQNFRLAVPLRKGQLSSRELLNGLTITKDIKAGSPLTIDDVDGPYSSNPQLKSIIMDRGI
jgi:N-acetylneuraminate synthase